MAKTDFRTIDEYHKSQPEEIQKRLQAIRDIIHKAVPEVEESISYQIPTFKYHGRLVYYAALSKHISILHPYSDAFLKHFAEDLKGYKMSKAAIQFPNNKPLPAALIKRIVEFRKKENKAASQASKKGKGKK
jgi:uncharacterized protein YdhG (YjbR/CyaY superfamily)